MHGHAHADAGRHAGEVPASPAEPDDAQQQRWWIDRWILTAGSSTNGPWPN
jgi:predicted cobalt transporter CbtA